MSLWIHAARLAGDRPIRLVEAGGRPGAVRDRRQTGVRLLPPLDSTAMPDVRDSFSRVAANYSKSTFHTSSARLQEVLDLARPKRGDLALDVATGTGNTAFALAPYVRRVIGLDVTRAMLDQARRAPAERHGVNSGSAPGRPPRRPRH